MKKTICRMRKCKYNKNSEECKLDGLILDENGHCLIGKAEREG